MSARRLVVVKLFETASRGLFVLACVYGLPIEEAGRYGLFATAVGLIAFAIGFERQIDVQRRVAGLSTRVVKARFADTLRFFAAQYALLLPALALAAWAAGWPAAALALGLVIVAGEHFSLQAYQAVLVSPSALPLMVAVAAKNFLQLLAVVGWPLLSGERLRLEWVLNLWAISSICFLVIAALVWAYWRRADLGSSEPPPASQSISQQYRASWMHFLVGVVAVAALQIDRLVVGATLSPGDVGIYFRNVTLAGLALQIFNVASFNRVAPGVYMHSRNGAWGVSANTVRREYRRFAAGVLLLGTIVLGVNFALGEPLHRWHLETGFLGVMAAVVLVRAAADYDGLILLSTGGDAAVFRNQASAVLAGAAALALLSNMFGLIGAFLGALVTPASYLLLNRISVRQRLGAAGPVPS